MADVGAGGSVADEVVEQRFLAGPEGRTSGLFQAVRVFREMIRGFRSFHFLGPSVTVFGSARFDEGHPYYEMAREVGAELAKVGFTVVTGGGPGVMEAANRGAKEAGGETMGAGIVLPREQRRNFYIDHWHEFRYFFVRKVMLIKYSYAFIVLPGGFGTLDELFEAATLIQTEKIRDFPIVLMGTSYWQPLLEFMQSTMVREGVIEGADYDRFLVTDSPTEAAEAVRDTAVRKFGVHYTSRRPRRRRWLIE